VESKVIPQANALFQIKEPAQDEGFRKKKKTNKQHLSVIYQM